MITEVEIVFENCDFLKLENKDIYSIGANNIIENASSSNLFQHHTEFEEAHKSHKLFSNPNWDDSHFHVTRTSKDIYISIYKDALIGRKTSFGSDALERLNFGDITQLHIHTKEPKRSFRVPKFLQRFFSTWSIPLTWEKESFSIYPIYEEEDENQLGSPNIYQVVTEEVHSNYYKDRVININIIEDLKKKKDNDKKKSQKKNENKENKESK